MNKRSTIPRDSQRFYEVVKFHFTPKSAPSLVNETSLYSPSDLTLLYTPVKQNMFHKHIVPRRECRFKGIPRKFKNTLLRKHCFRGSIVFANVQRGHLFQQESENEVLLRRPFRLIKMADGDGVDHGPFEEY
jgi:hypothetical protein